MSRPDQPTVEISGDGRSGSVRYRELAGELSFYWEFGGGDVMTSVRVGTPAEWREHYAWAAGRRAEILRFVAAEVVRQKAPTCRAKIDDAAGLLHLIQTGAQVPPAEKPAADGAKFVTRLSRLRAALGTVVFVLAALAAGAIWLAEKFLTIDTGKGTSIDLTVRTDRHAATLIQTLEPYAPSLHREHSLDRYSLSLFLVPLDGSPTQLVSLQGGMTGSAISRSRILGSDGRTLWYDADGVGGVDLQTLSPLDAEDLRAKQPPASLRGPRPLRFANEPAEYLAAGYFVAPKEWLGLASQAELGGEYKPGKWIRRIVRAESARVPRRLYLAKLEPGTPGDHHRILGMTPVGEAQYVNAAFLRRAHDAEPVRMRNPDGALMLYSSDAGLGSTVKIARMTDAGAIAWDVDTGIDRFLLSQILPGDGSTLFVGPRPSVPDRVPEPLLVIVDHASGKATTHSLWQ